MESIKIIIRKIKDGSIKEMWDEFKWMMSYAKNYKKEIIFYIFLGMFSTVMTLISSIASKELIDVVTGHKISKAPLMAVIMISMSLFSLFFGSIMSRITIKINIRIQNDIQADIFDKIIGVNWLDLSKYPSGDILNRFGSDVSTVANSAIGWVPDIIVSIFNFIATLCVVMYYDPTMMVLTLINAPIMLISSKLMMSKMRKYNMKVKEMNSEVMDFQTETFSNMDSIKSFDLTDLFSRRLRDFQDKYKEVNLEYNLFSIKTNIILSLIGMVIQNLFFVWAVYRLWTGNITYGEMTLFMTQSGRMSSAFSSLVSIIPSTVNSTISAKRLMELISLPREDRAEDDCEGLKDSVSHGFSVKLKDVDFSYVKEKQVIKSSSFEANRNEIVALVGPSGQGKTTLIRMFLGLLSPNSGEAVLCDKNGEEVTLNASTRKYFSYVPQGNTIFSGTIAQNLRMVKEDATDEEIIEALEIACAYEFVKELPDGINTKVGARGRGFSEGQAQRISIARAILRDAPILLLDEATSALDIFTEKKVLNNIIKQKPNKTCIVTTHRPSVLNLCQRVYKVEKTKLSQLSETEFEEFASNF
ncbi:ABC transporter ATP-binding protein [Intestinibacter bartlettii]|uniref:ABC transporter ATP-binding protein/permease n=1 Tax=Intestinibacter bartlettii TaxID=261299 RepID=A0ABS6DXH3_9FIRM|nr:ABC transporter ATP-binding protein [Intestinibacter bartlettii]MBU5336546.1 ABC transporter ATP-binding protein/permease [Intestinibacter bartlettii]